jgi:BirA family biotin operon repressor/biotin-[acetyl-CoA-carboxylase] ligase
MTQSLPDDFAEAVSARPELRGYRFEYRSVVTSTNDLAVVLAATDVETGTVVVADRQTAGRGRRGHDWHSPPGVGIYMSVILRHACSPIITLLAGVSVVESIHALTGVGAELKWPNDVIVRSRLNKSDSVRVRKVAGILVEALPAESGGGVVIGIGVNVRSSPRPSELEEMAASLDELSDTKTDRAPLCADIRVRLEEWLRRLQLLGSSSVTERWRALSPSSHGVPVSWEETGIRKRGITNGIDETGALLVLSEEGAERVVGGELFWEL